MRPAPGAKTAKTRVGRGEGSKGKTAGRGTKGTKARYQVKAGFEGGQMPLHMSKYSEASRLQKSIPHGIPELSTSANWAISTLEGGEVTVADLVEKGAVRKNQPVKVLGNGDLKVKLTVQVDKVSSSAEQKIVAAGGEVK